MSSAVTARGPAEGVPEASRIAVGQWVVLCTEKQVKCVKINKGGKIKVGKLSIQMDGALGYPLGTKFTVQGSKLVKIEHAVITKTAAAFVETVTAPAADGQQRQNSQDNRHLSDKDGAAQSLGTDAIEAMKKAGVDGNEIVGEVIKNSATFKSKTVFSQEKYVTAKSKKYSTTVVVARPTTRLLSRYYYDRSAEKICGLRGDSLAGMLTKCNIRTGSKVLVVDTACGLLTAAALERVGAHGTVLQLYQGDRMVDTAVANYNFPTEVKDNLWGYPLYAMKQLAEHGGGGDATEPVSPAVTESVTAVVQPAAGAMEVSVVPAAVGPGEAGGSGGGAAAADGPAKPTTDETAEDTERRLAREQRRNKRRATLSRSQDLLRAKNMDALLMVTKFHPKSTLEVALPLLAPSRPFAIFCTFKEPLTECYVYCKRKGVINLNLTENWTAEHQVLSNRTHPHMMMDAGAGFILSGTTTAAPETAAAAAAAAAPAATGKREAADADAAVAPDAPSSKKAKTE